MVFCWFCGGGGFRWFQMLLIRLVTDVLGWVVRHSHDAMLKMDQDNIHI